MKDVISDLKNIDVKEQYHTVMEITSAFLESYKRNNSWKIRLIDTFIVFNGVLFVVQLLYVLLNGLFPMNALISGLICCLGSITLAGKYIIYLNSIFKVIS